MSMNEPPVPRSHEADISNLNNNSVNCITFPNLIK